MNTYVALAIADSMFPEGVFEKTEILPEKAKQLVQADAISCVNPAHQSTLAALHQRYGIDITVPTTAEKISLQIGDQIVVCSVRGLPRETREFSTEEIAQATFSFSRWRFLRRLGA